LSFPLDIPALRELSLADLFVSIDLNAKEKTLLVGGNTSLLGFPLKACMGVIKTSQGKGAFFKGTLPADWSISKSIPKLKGSVVDSFTFMGKWRSS
jgi:hypothetical protein